MVNDEFLSRARLTQPDVDELVCKGGSSENHSVPNNKWEYICALKRVI